MRRTGREAHASRWWKLRIWNNSQLFAKEESEVLEKNVCSYGPRQKIFPIQAEHQQNKSHEAEKALRKRLCWLMPRYWRCLVFDSWMKNLRFLSWFTLDVLYIFYRNEILDCENWFDLWHADDIHDCC
jgi:hypothetical protein